VNCEVRFSLAAISELTKELLEKIASGAMNFALGALRDKPRRVGMQLEEPLIALHSADGEYRVIYLIVDEKLIIKVVSHAMKPPNPSSFRRAIRLGE
jgi:mRNA interferase RelE/StbE